MKSKILRLFLAGIVLCASACTANYMDINKEPSTVDKDQMEADGYLTRIPLVALQGLVIPNDVNMHQFIECLLGGSMGGYLADSNQGFRQKYSTYNPEEHWIQVPFNDLIPNTFQNFNKLISLSEDKVQIAVAAITKIAIMARVTDIYGPVPYSKIGEDGKQTAPYDSQKEIYTSFFTELDEAIEVLTTHRTDKFTPLADKVYGGNVENWAKFANSLKLRLAMRVVNADEALAKTKAEEAVNSEVGVFTSNSDNATFETTKNPFRVVMYEYNGGDSRISADITSYMNGYSDPRRAAYFTESVFTEDANGDPINNGFFGLRSGVIIPKGEYRKYSNMKVESGDKLLWMNAAEVAFLRAEGALRGWNMQGSAESLYNTGITLSFEQWGVNGADAYLANSDKTPQPYKDPQGFFSYTGTPSTITIKWNSSVSFEKNLEQIITQKWIANFPLGHEAWAEFRRTGYPKLMEALDNKSSSTVNDKRMARRLMYPQSEYTENAVNVSNAVSEYLFGPDNMGTDLWWAKKN